MHRRAGLVVFAGITACLVALCLVFASIDVAPKNLDLLVFSSLILVFAVLDRIYRDSTTPKRRILIGAIVIVTISIFGYRTSSRVTRVLEGAYLQSWNVYHYYIGSKYFEELGYFDLYNYTFLADQEGRHLLEESPYTRDLHNYEHITPEQAIASADRARFSDSRWEEFKGDLEAIFNLTEKDVTIGMTQDLGYNATPFGHFVFSTISRSIPIQTPHGRVLICLLDWILLVPCLVFLMYTYGLARGSLFFACFMLFFGIDKNHLGAMLRFSWLCATICAFCFYKRGNFKLAGICFAFAVAERIFPILFLAGPILRAAIAFLKKREFDKKLVPLGLSFCVALTVFLGASLTTGRHLQNWPEFAENMKTHVDYQYKVTRKMGLKRFFASDLSNLDTPATNAGRAAAYEKQRSLHYVFATVLLLVVLGCMALMKEPENMLVGIMMAFTVTVMSRYYFVLWFVLLLFGLTQKSRKMGVITDVLVIGLLPSYFLLRAFDVGMPDSYTLMNGYVILSILIFAATYLLLVWRARSAAAR